MILLIPVISTPNLNGQALELIGGNSVNGALTGSILGAATMGLTDNSNLNTLKIGAGAGILGGIAISIHDIAVLPRGDRFYISGTFNDGTNSSILILLDTFYGVVTGTVVGTASRLIADKPILDGMKVGASAGAWTGFVFGLADAFFLGKRNEDFVTGLPDLSGSLLNIHNDNFKLNVLYPGLVSLPSLVDQDLVKSSHPVMGLFTLHASFSQGL